MNLTEHFTLEELTRSATAQQRHPPSPPALFVFLPIVFSQFIRIRDYA